MLSQPDPPSCQLEFPEHIDNETLLDGVLTQPSPALCEALSSLTGPLLVLGAGGKMGPTLCVMARRAAAAAGKNLEVIAVSRFRDTSLRSWMEERGVRTLECDLLNRGDLVRLPDAQQIVYLVGFKFGTSHNPALTWAMNTLVPANISERFCSRGARVAAVSTGNVYPFVPVSSGGALESQRLTPLGEYANAAVARERIFQYCAEKTGARFILIRLNYATELRYGVLIDIAQRVFHEEPLDLTTGYFNCIWQRDANDFILRLISKAAAPPAVINLTGVKIISVRETACRFGEVLNRSPRFTGTEAETALLSNAGKMKEWLGPPPTSLEKMMSWTAEWVQRSGRTFGRPTHFETRDGNY